MPDYKPQQPTVQPPTEQTTCDTTDAAAIKYMFTITILLIIAVVITVFLLRR